MNAKPKARTRILLHGFSLIELLIVVAIIGMLISLTLPAIRASREAGRRTSCLNNCRQIGQAIQGYHDARNELPPSRVKDGFVTWAALVLPYLEEATAGNLVEPSLNFYRQPEAMRMKTVQVFLCPSRARRKLTAGTGNGKGAKGDYACMSSTFLPKKAEDGGLFDGAIIYAESEIEDPKARPQRLKWWKSRTAFRDISDGLSNTFMVIEGSFWASERASIYSGLDQPGAILGDKKVPEEVEKRGAKGRGIADDWPLVQDMFVGSAHPEVVIGTFADGASFPVNKSADLSVLEQLVTRAGHESTSIEDVSH